MCLIDQCSLSLLLLIIYLGRPCTKCGMPYTASESSGERSAAEPDTVVLHNEPSPHHQRQLSSFHCVPLHQLSRVSCSNTNLLKRHRRRIPDRSGLSSFHGKQLPGWAWPWGRSVPR